MALAKSQVQVSINAGLGQGFSAAFQTADARLVGLRKTASDTAKTLGNIDAYRKQQDAVNQTKQVWQSAREKAKQFSDAIKAQGAPTKAQVRELAALEKTANRAGEAYGKQRVKLAEMGRELQRTGVNTAKLGSEYERLTSKMAAADAKQLQMEKSLQRQQRIVSAMGGTWQTVAKSAASVTAAGAVLAGPTRKALTYDQQLSYAADTATAGAGREAYQSNKKAISDGIDAAIKGGGGKREDAGEALNTMISSGAFDSVNEALAMLGDVVKTAHAAGASASQIAEIAVALKSFGITDMNTAFSMAMKAGQVGGFELKNMAEHLPSQLALAKQSGYAGINDYGKILALNQAARKTAGRPDEAGNNVINLLQKMSADEMNTRMAKHIKPRAGDAVTTNSKGKKTFDWTGHLVKSKEQGIDAVGAMTILAEREVEGDKRYQELKKKLGIAKNDKEFAATLGEMSKAMFDIVKGGKMGEFFADRQALLGALAAVYHKDYMKKVEAEASPENAKGTIEQSSANIRDETWSRAIDTQNALNRANEQAYNALQGPMGKVLEFTNGLATAYPNLTASVYGATTALTALAAAVGVWGIAGKVLGGGGAAAAAGAAGAAATSGAASTATATGAAGVASTAARLAGPMAMLTGVANMTTNDEDEELRTGKQRRAALVAQHGQATVDEARKKYKPWYQFGSYASEDEKWVAQLQAEKAKTGATPATAPAAVPGQQTQAVQNPLADKVLESSTAAAEAAKAAGEAATAAQNRPNVTQNNTYQVTVQATQQDPAGIVALFDQTMRQRDREKNAELRASMMGNPRY